MRRDVYIYIYIKMQKLLTKFPVLRLQAVMTPQRLQMPKSHSQMFPLGDVYFPFLPVESLQSLSPGMYVEHPEGTYPNIWQRPVSDIVQ